MLGNKWKCLQVGMAEEFRVSVKEGLESGVILSIGGEDFGCYNMSNRSIG